MIRIGELAKRAGVSPELLRAWERRYSLLTPARTESGYRLYDGAAVERIRRMRELIDEGMSAAQAASAVLSSAPAGSPHERPIPLELAAQLADALARLDEAAAHDAIDRLLGAVTVEAFATGVALPLLRRIGDDWAAGRTTVGHEHFATALLRGRLLGVARGWDRGAGPRVAVACLPGEQHDIGLIAFGIALSQQGLRVLYLGQDTPVATLHDLATRKACDIFVVASVDRELFAAHARELRRAVGRMPLAIGGAGADATAGKRSGAILLPPDPVVAARELVSELRR